MATHQSQYDRCRCGARKLKRSEFCWECHCIRLDAAQKAHSLALAHRRGELVTITLKNRGDIATLDDALRAAFAVAEPARYSIEFPIQSLERTLA